ncbi:putative inactive receptor kinase, partial [Trifolium medium]|nr:putative inactive receptor kinase [Trifolium medium]
MALPLEVLVCFVFACGDSGKQSGQRCFSCLLPRAALVRSGFHGDGSAQGSAKGIANFVHKGGLKFVHGNIKSTNVLITQENDGCITDLGFTPLMNTSSTTPSSNGYRSPEASESRNITTQKSVWVRFVVREEWTAEVFDEEMIRGGECVEEEM